MERAPSAPAPRSLFGPDGAIYLGSLQGTIRVVDPGTVQVVRTVGGPPLSSNVNLALTADGLLVGTGRAAIVAIETSTGATRWTADIYNETGADPYPCLALAVAPVAERFYCGNAWGLFVERDLATGLDTGVRFDTQLGVPSNLAIASDGRELVAFGRLPVVSRWRLDGSGAIVDHVAAGHNATGGYDSTGEMLLVAAATSARATPRLSPTYRSTPRCGTPSPMNPSTSSPTASSRRGSGATSSSGTFAGSNWLYDVNAHAPVASNRLLPPPTFLWTTPDGRRTYGSVVDTESKTGPRCEIRTYDSDRRERREPTHRARRRWATARSKPRCRQRRWHAGWW